MDHFFTSNITITEGAAKKNKFIANVILLNTSYIYERINIIYNVRRKPRLQKWVRENVEVKEKIFKIEFKECCAPWIMHKSKTRMYDHIKIKTKRWWWFLMKHVVCHLKRFWVFTQCILCARIFSQKHRYKTCMVKVFVWKVSGHRCLYFM